jgi:hypothetical protein
MCMDAALTGHSWYTRGRSRVGCDAVPADAARRPSVRRPESRGSTGRTTNGPASWAGPFVVVLSRRCRVGATWC